MQNISRGYASRVSIPRAIIPLVSAMQKLYCRETRKATAVNDRSCNSGRRIHRPGVYGNDVRTTVASLYNLAAQSYEIQNRTKIFIYRTLHKKKDTTQNLAISN